MEIISKDRIDAKAKELHSLYKKYAEVCEARINKADLYSDEFFRDSYKDMLTREHALFMKLIDKASDPLESDADKMNLFVALSQMCDSYRTVIAEANND